MRALALGLLGLLMICKSALTQEAVPAGGEFQINTDTTESQGSPPFAAGTDGSFVVVRGKGGGGGIVGQRLPKLHEGLLRVDLSEIGHDLGQRATIKGELTVVIGAAERNR